MGVDLIFWTGRQIFFFLHSKHHVYFGGENVFSVAATSFCDICVELHKNVYGVA